MIGSHARGFVLARYERGEADLLVELLLDDGSIARAVGKSALRSTRRFSGGLMAFTLYRFVVGRMRSGSSVRLDEASVERAYPGILSDLRRTSAAGAAAVVARDLGGEVAMDAALFDLYLRLMEQLESADSAASGRALIQFAFAAFEHAGHPIVLDECVRCGRAVPDNAMVQLRPDSGGVVCAACGGGTMSLRGAERRALRRVLDEGDTAAVFDAAMLESVAALIEPHARRGADVIRGAATHWRSREALK